MIIETSDNRFFKVEETMHADLQHVWYGLEMKLDRNGIWQRKSKTIRTELVRKAATRIVEAA